MNPETTNTLEGPGPSSGASGIDEDDFSGWVPQEGRRLIARGGFSHVYLGTLNSKSAVAPIKVCATHLG